MSEKRYTLTIFVAAPGTPLLKDGQVQHQNGKLVTSDPGHIFYGISADGGKTVQAYGFAPVSRDKLSLLSFDMRGNVQKNEHKVYQNPVYARTMEITEQQFKTLESFGKSPQSYGFNKDIYNWMDNSCVDFTYTALTKSGIYQGREITYRKEGVEIGTVRSPFEGTVKVLPNIREFEKISNQVPNSNLNKTQRNPMPERSFVQNLMVENEQNVNPEQPQYAQARSLSIGDVPAPAQKLYAQTEERMRAFYQEFDVPFQEHELKNAAAALAVVAYEKRLPEVQDFELHNGRMVAFYESRGGAYKEALLDAGFANNMPQQESFVRMTEAEPKLELAAQQRAMEIAAYEQSQSMGRSI